VAVGHGVRTLENLVLLEVHLESGLIREVDKSLLEFNELLD
jgi:hypothetical protein